MTAKLLALAFDAHDPSALARFWAGVLGRELAHDDRDGTTLLPGDDTGFRIRFLPTQEAKTHPNQMHFDITSQSLAEQEATVARVLELGGRHLDIGQLPEEEHVVMADPEGNELCVIEAGNNFLADTGPIGAISSDGSRQVGHFWSEALGWPLVWDQDEETAIQSPRGGSKISWGGPPWREKTGRNRLHLELVPEAGGDQQGEVDRLVSIGATRLDAGECAPGWVPMADPDGNEFCLGLAQSDPRPT